MLSVSGYRGIELKRYEHEEQKRAEEHLMGYRVVRKGQLVVNTMWLNYAGLGVSELEGYVSPAYRSYWISDRLDGKYAHYLLRSHIYVEGYTGLMQGIRPNSLQIKNSDFHRIPVLVPKHNEQQRIADFLDQKTAEVDEAIAKKKRLIELFKEQKAILINQAVTKGLDPNAPMRDSGVQGIVEIPKHWEVVRLKYLLKRLVDSEHKTAPSAETGDYLIVRTSNVRGGKVVLDDAQFADLSTYRKWIKRAAPERGDVLLTREAPAGEACVLEKDNYALLGQRMVLLRPDRRLLDPHFCVYSLYEGAAKHYIKLLSLGSTVLHLNMSDIKNVPIILPPLEEQARIASFLTTQIGEFDTALEAERLGIVKLDEFKMSLISETVTGRIKV